MINKKSKNNMSISKRETPASSTSVSLLKIPLLYGHFTFQTAHLQISSKKKSAFNYTSENQGGFLCPGLV
jgi:hypothetical protein